LQRVIASDANSNSSHITVNINQSTMAALNLGTVMGDLQAAVTQLRRDNPNIAEAIARLAEAVSRDETLGHQRGSVIQSLEQIAEEGAKPAANRRTALVRLSLMGLGVVLSQSANAAQIWQTWGPAIKAFFGLQ